MSRLKILAAVFLLLSLRLFLSGQQSINGIPNQGIGGSLVTVEHVFSGAGSFTYTHGTGVKYPVLSCYAASGSASYTATPLTNTTMSIAVPAASDLFCSFTGSTTTIGVQ